MKISILFFFILLFSQGCQRAKSDTERLDCLDKYISSISKREVYYEVRKGVLDSIENWRNRKLQVKCCDPKNTVLDSAVFFNEDFTRCIFLIVDSLDPENENTWNAVQTLGGEKFGKKWHYYHVSFTTLAYSLKANGYKNFSFEYLSKDARLDIIDRGFFKPGTCEIDWDFVDSEEWIADWVRKKHQQFLQGR